VLVRRSRCRLLRLLGVLWCLLTFWFLRRMLLLLLGWSHLLPALPLLLLLLPLLPLLGLAATSLRLGV
jgi:hypothetical protein